MEEQPTLGEKRPELAAVPTMPDATALEATMKRAEGHLKDLMNLAMEKVRKEVDAAWNPSIWALEEREREIQKALNSEAGDERPTNTEDEESMNRQLCAVEESLGTLRYSRMRSRVEMEQAVMRNLQGAMSGAMPRTGPSRTSQRMRTA